MHEFPIFYSHTDWNLLSSFFWDRLYFGYRVVVVIIIHIKYFIRCSTRIGFGSSQGLLQLEAWVSANGGLKDCMIKVYL